jgi:HAD superfamily hydrolase (TIGR01509 family)
MPGQVLLKGDGWMGLKGVFLDFGGTIACCEFNEKAFESNLRDYVRSLGFSGVEGRYRRARRRLFERLMTIRNQNREIRLEDLYQGLLFDLGIHPETDMLEFIHDLYIRSFRVEVVSGIEAVLKYLQSRYRLAIVSNSMSNVARWALPRFHLDKYFEAVVISRDIGIRKPDPEIFNFTLNTVGLEGSEVLHVGDSLRDDVQGGKNAGLRTVWIQSQKEERSELPDYTIQSINELTQLV